MFNGMDGLVETHERTTQKRFVRDNAEKSFLPKLKGERECKAEGEREIALRSMDAVAVFLACVCV